MRQRLNFWVIGGDPRQMTLARSLAEDGHTVHTYALDRGGEPSLAADGLAGAAVADCIRRGADRTQADRAFHAAIVRAAHNEFMMRLLPMIDRAVETAISAGEHKEALAQITLQDHALLLEFIQKRDGEGAEHAMAIHMRHAVEELGVEGL